MVWVMSAVTALAQGQAPILIKITDERQQPLSAANVELLKPDSSLIKISITDSAGRARFQNAGLATYILRVTTDDYLPLVVSIKNSDKVHTFVLRPVEKTMEVVRITGARPMIELRNDRTVVNVDASITGSGSTVMEILEKLPGVTLDAEGNISLKGKPNVLVMLDGKPTYLSGTELTNLLSGMTSAQVSQIELIDTPPPSMDASGSSIINIKTKKGLQRGFNGTFTTTGQQGFYPKSSNNLLLNFRSGRANFFLNYGLNTQENFLRSNALRTYFRNDGAVMLLLEQPSFLSSNNTFHNLRTGIDFAFSPSTSLNISLAGIWQDRNWTGNNTAIWMNSSRTVDSLIRTGSTRRAAWQNKRGSVNFTHRFSAKRELSADVDLIGYDNKEKQYVENNAARYSEAYLGNLPSTINIFVTKIDYSQQMRAIKLEAGAKASTNNTDNLADYYYNDGSGWLSDTGKSNHFIYKENIYSFYTNVKGKWNRWGLQAGLRTEITDYNARQLAKKDSSFSRNYGSLFPSFSVSFDKDSSNTFSFSAGRRIERPLYYKLNPFVQIINKYTYQQGNPFLRPQYIWNVQLNHAYKNTLLTGVSYSLITDYLMQVFPTSGNRIVTYTDGNLGRLQIFGASAALQKSVGNVWSFVLQTQAAHKRLQGVVLGKSSSARFTQYTINLSNQLRFGKNWTGDVNGFYNSSSQADVQEVLDPNGQFSLGIAKNVAQNRGTLKLSVRDIFYTGWFKGLSQFSQANEYFKQTRDTRYLSLTFTWRFGNAYKTAKHTEGAAGDEIQRVGND